MILSFGDKATEDLYHGLQTARLRHIPSSIWKAARRKLDMIEYAHRLDDLRVPPENHLKALQGNLARLHSIRINDQWRVVFRWEQTGAYDVAVVDYH